MSTDQSTKMDSHFFQTICFNTPDPSQRLFVLAHVSRGGGLHEGRCCHTMLDGGVSRARGGGG